MIEALKEIYNFKGLKTKAPKLTPEETAWHEMGKAIISENWVKIKQIADRDQLTSAEYLDRVAMAACYVYAAKREPTRCKEWSAIETLLGTIHYPEWAEALEGRAANV
jgi:hypothetical protein